MRRRTRIRRCALLSFDIGVCALRRASLETRALSELRPNAATGRISSVSSATGVLKPPEECRSPGFKASPVGTGFPSMKEIHTGSYS